MLSWTRSPARVNFASGTETILPPRPRKPPVLNSIDVTLPSGPDWTFCTVPTLLPSDEKIARPIRGLAFAVADLSCGAGAGFWAGGMVASGLVAAGGVTGEDGGA